jgi:hypothetical protein
MNVVGIMKASMKFEHNNILIIGSFDLNREFWLVYQKKNNNFSEYPKSLVYIPWHKPQK